MDVDSGILDVIDGVSPYLSSAAVAAVLVLQVYLARLRHVQRLIQSCAEPERATLVRRILRMEDVASAVHSRVDATTEAEATIRRRLTYIRRVRNLMVPLVLLALGWTTLSLTRKSAESIFTTPDTALPSAP